MSIEDAVLKVETYINNVLKANLRNVLDERDQVLSDIAEYAQLKGVISTVQEADLGQQGLKTKVDLGCNFYVQAQVEDCSKIFLAVGFGFFAELTLSEAVSFIAKKIKLLEGKIEQLDTESAQIKADIKMFLDHLGQLQNIQPVSEAKRAELFW